MPPLQSPYSIVGDLLIGDLLISASVDKQSFVNDAADEMDSKLGYIYKLPLEPVSPATQLPDFQVKLLKSINNRLASGRLILTLDIAGEGSQLHAYGWSLVRDARADLMRIANGDVDLYAVRSDVDLGKIPSRTPAIHNYDSESLVTVYENTIHRSDPWYARPGPSSI